MCKFIGRTSMISEEQSREHSIGLRECPLCGSSDITTELYKDKYEIELWVHCRKCNLAMPVYEEPMECTEREAYQKLRPVAIDKWNKRYSKYTKAVESCNV